MSEILITDVTVTVTERLIQGRKRIHRGTITFGNSILGMPMGGVPLPRISAFGMLRELATLELSPSDDNSLQPYVYNSTSNRLVPLDTDMSPEVEGKLSQVPPGVVSSVIGNIAATSGSEDRPTQTVLNYVATGW